MKLQIVTAADNLPDWFERIALPRMKWAAETWNATLVVMKPTVRMGVTVKMLLAEQVPLADRTLFVDGDLIISRRSPNPFEVFPPGFFYAAADSPPGNLNNWNRADEMAFSQAILGSIRWASGYFNTGVMICDKNHAGAWTNYIHCPFTFPEQTFTNYRVRELGYALKELPWQWNATIINTPKDRKQSDGYIPHAAGIVGQARADWMIAMDKEMP